LPQQSKNNAAAPIVMSNPAIGSGVRATDMVFYDVGSGGEGLPRSSAQFAGVYANTDSYFVGLLNSLHLRDDRVRSRAGLFHAKINNEPEDQFPLRCGCGQW